MAHHYYGSTALNWATGKTRQEVLEKLAKSAGGDYLKRAVKNTGGLYAWTVRVDAPQDANYQIAYFQPVDVPMGNAQEFNIMTAKGYSLPIDREPKADDA